MALQFHKIKVKDIIRETKEAVSVVFDIPADLKDQYKYLPGQYLTLRIIHDGKDERRAYSASSSPYTDTDIAVTVKEVENGFVSSYVNNKLQTGETVDLMTPLGHFIIEPYERNERNIVLIGGGSGITPLMSILKSILTIEKNSKVLLIYCNRDEDSTIFRNKLTEFQNQYPNFKLVDVLSQPKNGHPAQRLTSGLLEGLIRENISGHPIEYANYYVCGPRGLTETALECLQNLNIAKERIHKESFVAAEKVEVELPESEKPQEKISTVKVRLYGEETEIPIDDDETILVAGMRASLDPPFSCQIGACSTCRAKLVSGRVHMDDYDALTDNEIQQGYILTCTAHPLTNDVLVDYDD